MRSEGGHIHGSIGNESVLIQMSQCWPFPILKYKYISQIKYTEEILSHSTWKLLWFEITKMLIALLAK